MGPAVGTRTLAAVKQLLAFGQRTGYLPLNIGAAVKLPQRKDTLAERILTEADVDRLLTSSSIGATRSCCGCSTTQACSSRRSPR